MSTHVDLKTHNLETRDSIEALSLEIMRLRTVEREYRQLKEFIEYFVEQKEDVISVRIHKKAIGNAKSWREILEASAAASRPINKVELK